MERRIASLGIFVLLFVAVSSAQVLAPASQFPVLLNFSDGSDTPDAAPRLDLSVNAPRPRMAPELALATYFDLARRQLAELGSYSDQTTVDADLPDSSQHGNYQLRRTYQAPSTLAFAAIRFVGDGFVKTNVITRLLQSEVDHVEKGEGARTAITSENYKFNYKGADVLADGTQVYVFNVKPRQKRVGLFKGRICIDALSGHLRRAEGTMVKSPSFFLKKLEFFQDYTVVGQFSLPAYVYSKANTRLFGRAIVTIFHDRYDAKSMAELYRQATAAASAPGSAPGSN
ncbi:MAG: hypothetical protein ACR2IF_01355 [Terriglobales bacterium]